MENDLERFVKEREELEDRCMKLIDEKLGGTTPLNIILKFDSEEIEVISEEEDESNLRLIVSSNELFNLQKPK